MTGRAAAAEPRTATGNAVRTLDGDLHGFTEIHPCVGITPFARALGKARHVGIEVHVGYTK